MARRTGRYGFTLIELIVVILVIAVLVALLMAAASMAMKKIPVVQSSTDIAQMNLGLSSLAQDYLLAEPPPTSFNASPLPFADRLWLVEDRKSLFSVYGVSSSGVNPLFAATVNYFQRVFGRNNYPGLLSPDDWNGNGVVDPPYCLYGQQSLVFWLGGVVNRSGTGTIDMGGFARNNLTPSAPASVSAARRGPYFSFAPARLVDAATITNPLFPPSVFPVYLDPYPNKAAQPYAFFSTGGLYNKYNPLDCLLPWGNSPRGASVYMDGKNYINGNTFQIICAGADGMFGYDPLAPGIAQWSPIAGLKSLGLDAANKPAGADDQANFSQGVLDAGQ